MLYKLKSSSKNNFIQVAQKSPKNYSCGWFVKGYNEEIFSLVYRTTTFNIGLKLREVDIFYARIEEDKIITENKYLTIPSLELLMEETICYIPKEFLIELPQEEENISFELSNNTATKKD
jgi:hypothetical protein